MINLSHECVGETMELTFCAFPACGPEEQSSQVNAFLAIVSREVMRERIEAAKVAGMILDEEREKWMAQVRRASAS